MDFWNNLLLQYRYQRKVKNQLSPVYTRSVFMLGFCPLASGSKGNAIFIGTKNSRILIDMGISYSMLCERLLELSVDVKTIQAVLITHEHSDHISGLRLLCERLNIPVLANAETAKGICGALKIRPRFKIFTTGESFIFQDIEVHPFSVPHDTLDPVGFILQMDGLKLGFCADLGHVTSLVKERLMGCDYLYLEANHEPSMVHASHRPAVYKERVLSKQGHLSNQECADLLIRLHHPGLKHVHLAHLSVECNHEDLALKTVRDALEKKSLTTLLSIAYQDRVSNRILF